MTGASHRGVPGRASGVRLAVKITNPAPSSETSVVCACERAELGYNLHTEHIAMIAWDIRLRSTFWSLAGSAGRTAPRGESHSGDTPGCDRDGSRARETTGGCLSGARHSSDWHQQLPSLICGLRLGGLIAQTSRVQGAGMFDLVSPLMAPRADQSSRVLRARTDSVHVLVRRCRASLVSPS